MGELAIAFLLRVIIEVEVLSGQVQADGGSKAPSKSGESWLRSNMGGLGAGAIRRPRPASAQPSRTHLLPAGRRQCPE